MKKIIAGITAMLLVSSMAVYAGDGGKKKKAKKAARKNECCVKPVCCDKTKCNSVSYTEKATAEETKVSENEKQSCCIEQTASCTKKD